MNSMLLHCRATTCKQYEKNAGEVFLQSKQLQWHGCENSEPFHFYGDGSQRSFDSGGSAIVNIARANLYIIIIGYTEGGRTLNHSPQRPSMR